LINIPFPALPGSPSVVYELKIINDLEKFILIDTDIVNSDKDTAITIPALAEYSATLDDLVLALNTIDMALKIKR